MRECPRAKRLERLSRLGGLRQQLAPRLGQWGLADAIIYYNTGVDIARHLRAGRCPMEGCVGLLARVRETVELA